MNFHAALARIQHTALMINPALASEGHCPVCPGKALVSGYLDTVDNAQNFDTGTYTPLPIGIDIFPRALVLSIPRTPRKGHSLPPPHSSSNLDMWPPLLVAREPIAVKPWTRVVASRDCRLRSGSPVGDFRWTGKALLGQSIGTVFGRHRAAPGPLRLARQDHLVGQGPFSSTLNRCGGDIYRSGRSS